MANLNKIDVPIAVTHKTKLDLSCDHVTSMGFMTTQPVFYRHMIKGEHISINASSTVRPAPIEVPSFGQLNQNLRYFFVPYRLVFPNWDSFYNDVIASNYSTNSLVSTPPILKNSILVSFFTTAGLISNVSSGVFDFTYGGSNYQYTPYGRFILKLLRSLGYEVIWSNKGSDIEYNALALLAYVKIYLDWYANSQYLNSADTLLFERAIKFNDPSSNLDVSVSLLGSLFQLVNNVIYDTDDYFVNAWDNPVSPNAGQYTSFSFLDPTTNSGTYVTTNSLGSPEMISSSNVPLSVGTTYIHEALKKLTDFQKRHALAGARSIDRVLAQYGVVTDYLKQQRSIYVGNQQTSIDIGSVYATASGSNGSDSSSTGDYSGAGFGMRKDFNLDFHADEEGVLICVASIIPSGTIVQGYDRNNLHINKTDFFVPEFDSLGVQALEKGEVYVSPTDTYAATASDYRGVFGFTGRYGEYKRPKSFFTGDMTLVSAMDGGRAWVLNRLFTDSSFGSITQQVHSLSFTRGQDADQYHRIFQYVDAELDPFYCFMHFNVASFAPCKPLFETYEFEDNGKQVPTENGNKVN